MRHPVEKWKSRCSLIAHTLVHGTADGLFAEVVAVPNVGCLDHLLLTFPLSEMECNAEVQRGPVHLRAGAGGCLRFISGAKRPCTPTCRGLFEMGKNILLPNCYKWCKDTHMSGLFVNATISNPIQTQSSNISCSTSE